MKIFKITLVLFLFTLELHAQENCTGFEEWFRKRHTISGMTYGHPYTTFDRHNGLSLPFGHSVGISLPLGAKQNLYFHNTKEDAYSMTDWMPLTPKTGIYTYCKYQ
jgi:hypothetical protein